MDTRSIIPMTRRGDVTFHADGRIDLTAHVVKALDLHPGDVINIIKSDDEHPEHYLYRSRMAAETTGRHTCVCHPANKGGNYLRVFNKQMAHYILGICDSCNRISLRVGGLTELTGRGRALPIIITASLTNPETTTLT